MSRVLPFSRTFPAYHPKAGQDTYFVEKILFSLPDFKDTAMGIFNGNEEYLELLFRLNPDFEKADIRRFWRSLNSGWFLETPDNEELVGKHHTIRDGNRWKAGDWFSPRVWSGKPCNSKQIIIAPDIQVKKEWRVEINFRQNSPVMFVPDVQTRHIDMDLMDKIAVNDGLDPQDFFGWFLFDKKADPFRGQIICWSPSVEYKSNW